MLSAPRLLATLMLGVTVAPPANGADWSAMGELQIKAGYDGNLRFQVTDPLDTPRTTYGVETRVQRLSETTQTTLDFDYSFLNADRADFADSEDYSVELASRWQGERFGAAVSAAERRANTLTAIFVDTGFIDLGVQRQQRLVSPQLSWSASERVTYTLAATDEQVEFLQPTTLVDYDFRAYSLERRTALSPRTQYFVALSRSELDASEVRSVSEISTLTIGFSRQVSESLNWELAVGANRTETDRVVRFFIFDIPVSDEDDGWRASASLTKSWPYATLTLSASQQLQPSGQGSLTERQLAIADLSYRLSETFSLGVNAQFNRFDEPGSLDNLSDDRDYGRLGLRFVYTPHPRWTIQLDAIHDTQTFDRLQDAARRDSAYLTVRYRGGRQ